MQVMATRKGQVTSPHLPRMVLAIVILMLARASHARAGPHIAPNTLWLRSSLASDIYSKVAEDQCIMGPLHDTWRHLDMNANMEACIVPAGLRWVNIKRDATHTQVILHQGARPRPQDLRHNFPLQAINPYCFATINSFETATVFKEDSKVDAWVCPAARLWLQPKPNGMKVYKLDGAAMRNLQDYYLPGLFSDVSVNIEGNMAMLQVKDVLGILGLSK